MLHLKEWRSWLLWSLCMSSLCPSSCSTSSSKAKYDPLTKANMANSYNFIIHGDWGWNSVNQSLSAYQMGIYGEIIQNKFVVALGDNVSLALPSLLLSRLSSLLLIPSGDSSMAMESRIQKMTSGIQHSMISSSPPLLLSSGTVSSGTMTTMAISMPR